MRWGARGQGGPATCTPCMQRSDLSAHRAAGQGTGAAASPGMPALGLRRARGRWRRTTPCLHGQKGVGRVWVEGVAEWPGEGRWRRAGSFIPLGAALLTHGHVRALLMSNARHQRRRGIVPPPHQPLGQPLPGVQSPRLLRTRDRGWGLRGAGCTQGRSRRALAGCSMVCTNEASPRLQPARRPPTHQPTHPSPTQQPPPHPPGTAAPPPVARRRRPPTAPRPPTGGCGRACSHKHDPALAGAADTTPGAAPRRRPR